MKRKYNWHCYQCGNKKNQKQFNKQDNFICSKCRYANANKAEKGRKRGNRMILNNPYCDICGRYCEYDWYEVEAKYRFDYRDLNEKRNETYIVCGKCKMALFDLIKERSLKESEEEE